MTTLPKLFPPLNPRILIILLTLTALISATTIATDILSPRNRTPLPTTTQP